MIHRLTISQLTQKLARRELSAAEALEACLSQIDRVDGQVHSFLSVDRSDARAQAAARPAQALGAERRRVGGPQLQHRYGRGRGQLRRRGAAQGPVEQPHVEEVAALTKPFTGQDPRRVLGLPVAEHAAE
mgnify:CR=1 FL=1